MREQFWGDMDRDAMDKIGVPYWPQNSPPPSHMGVLPSDIGPHAVVRLQAGGLKVGELLWKARAAGMSIHDAGAQLECSGYGKVVCRKL